MRYPRKEAILLVIKYSNMKDKLYYIHRIYFFPEGTVV